MTYVYYRHTTNPDAALAYPHYSCPVFSVASTGKWIYGKDTGTKGEYMDELWDWNMEQAAAATEQCKAEGLTENTARYIERWLGVYYERPVVLHGVLAGVQTFTGYPWYWYSFD